MKTLPPPSALRRAEWFTIGFFLTLALGMMIPGVAAIVVGDL